MGLMTVSTNGSTTTGTGTDDLTGLAYFQFPTGIAITAMSQVSCGTVANDADWALYVDGKTTEWCWQAEELNPANVGRAVLMRAITIAPGKKLQFKWSGQGSAAANKLKVQYDPI